MPGAPWHVRAFRSEDAPAFAALNRAWIERLFSVEHSDMAQLDDPQGAIIARGGYIVILERGGEIVATGAIRPATHPPDDGLKWMEVIKMATDPSAQRLGLGSAVLTRLLRFAEEAGADGVWLETSAKLTAAAALYRRHGFERLAPEARWASPFSRCNLQMVRRL